MITFEPTEEQRMMRDTVADLAKAKLRPRMRHTEEARALDDTLRAELAELGLGGLGIPEAHGGAGASVCTAVLVEEELGFGDAGAAFCVPGPGALAHAVVELGDDAQKKRVFDAFNGDARRVGAVAWSEPSPCKERPGFVTTARRDGDRWILDGTKAYVLNAGLAHTYVVFAQTDAAKGWEGIGAFLVDASAAGLSLGERYDTVGLDAARFGEVKLAGVAVPEADRLAGGVDFGRGLRRFFARQSLDVSARAVGVARAAWEVAREYADDRKAFGKPIGHFQAIAFMLADRLMDLDGARGLLWRAAWTFDTRRGEAGAKADAEILQRCAEAAAQASDVAIRCTDDAIQIHGGAGFVRDYPVEKFFRDAKQLALCMQTATTSDQLFAALVLGAPLDPALVLPTPDLQPIFV